MHLPAAWLFFVLPPAQMAPFAPPVPAVPAPSDAGPIFDPTDEEVLKDDKFPTDGPGLVEFFRQRVMRTGDAERIKTLIRQLGSDDFDQREDASVQLAGLGLRAKPLLLAALRDPDAEIAHRAVECLKQIDEGTASSVTAAAIRMLARRKPDGAAAALLDFLPAAGEEELAEQTRLSLADLAMRDGKAEPALVEALTDALPLKRGAAAFALGRAGAKDQLPAVRKLLQDPDPLVRYRTGMALAAARQKDAVPALIDLLGDLPRREASRVEELLYRIADDKAPTAGGLDAAALRKYRDAWKAWWDDHGAQVDVERLADAARTNGFTVLVLLDQGRVLELDSANHPRLEISQLNFPLDAQLLPDDHVLVAEHNGNRVTERDRSGAVVWERQIDAPLAAQRLPNGDTFIATQMGLTEVKRSGEEVFNYDRPNGEAIMKAQKLPNGDIAMVTQPNGAVGGSRFVRLDSKGKELREFNVNLRYSGGRIDVLPNGDVLIPEADSNRVVELDAHGGLVWEAPADQPIAAVRLSNGDTLITTYAEYRAVEVDHDGKEVWEARRDTRVTRAFRR
jgi:hypothetical protein